MANKTSSGDAKGSFKKASDSRFSESQVSAETTTSVSNH